MNQQETGGGSMNVEQRENAKALATGEALCYIQLLEQIAYGAIGYYNYAVINHFNRHALKADEELCAALSAVNWMNCDE
jgi:hypothetical protein